MCQQCTTDCVFFEGEFLGFTIALARFNDDKVRAGDICIITSDNPDFSFPYEYLKKDPMFGMSEEEGDALPKDSLLWSENWEFMGFADMMCQKIDTQLNGSYFRYGYRIIKAMQEEGYDEEKWPRWDLWFLHKLAEWVDGRKLTFSYLIPDKLDENGYAIKYNSEDREIDFNAVWKEIEYNREKNLSYHSESERKNPETGLYSLDK